MRLSISNLGWTKDQDEDVYYMMKEHGFSGLEIAPTRIFSELPYEKKNQIAVWAKELNEKYGFVISSMQSIWYGRQERLFGSAEERRFLIEYTKKAVDFAASMNCRNLVFGCPRNRTMLENADPEIGKHFFKEIGDYAAEKGTVIGVEANPPIYDTNYINDTTQALTLIEEVRSSGFLLNLDVGTMIQNNESADTIKGKVRFISHVHISEPGLRRIKNRELHKQLKKILTSENYQGFISIEMGRVENLMDISNSLQYVKEVFGDKEKDFV